MQAPEGQRKGHGGNSELDEVAPLSSTATICTIP